MLLLLLPVLVESIVSLYQSMLLHLTWKCFIFYKIQQHEAVGTVMKDLSLFLNTIEYDLTGKVKAWLNVI